MVIDKPCVHVATAWRQLSDSFVAGAVRRVHVCALESSSCFNLRLVINPHRKV